MLGSALAGDATAHARSSGGPYFNSSRLAQKRPKRAAASSRARVATPHRTMEDTTDATQQTTAAPPTPTTSTPRKSNVYSRLYDPKSYTGVYKKRFESDCHDLTERVVHDLSNAMRTNLNYDVSRPKARTASMKNISTPAPSAPAPPPAPAPVERPTTAPPVQEKLQGDPNDPHTLLKAVFHYYCRFGRTGPKGLGEKTLDNSNFVKLCRDCPDLLDSSFGKTDVDLIFVKAKKKGERRINYARFLDALGMIAIQKYGDMVRGAAGHFALQLTAVGPNDAFSSCAVAATRGVRPEATGGASRASAVPARVHRRQDGASRVAEESRAQRADHCRGFVGGGSRGSSLPSVPHSSAFHQQQPRVRYGNGNLSRRWHGRCHGPSSLKYVTTDQLNNKY